MRQLRGPLDQCLVNLDDLDISPKLVEQYQHAPLRVFGEPTRADCLDELCCCLNKQQSAGGNGV